MKINQTLVLVPSIAALVALASPAHADEPITGCQSDNWGFLGLTQKRIICDSPIHPDGNWDRVRLIIKPAYHQYAHSQCDDYGGCTFYPAADYPTEIDDRQQYPVNDGNVVQGEPGHLDNDTRY